MCDDVRDAGILVTGKLAAALPTMCCGAEVRDRATWVMRPLSLKTHEKAGVACLTWCCSTNSHTTHSQWINADDAVHATKVMDANKALRRGVHEQSFEAENGGRVELWCSPTLGRFTVAQRRIEAGECALQATAFAVVVKQTRVRTHCHWCFAALVRKGFQCGACQFARYCSRACLDADEPLHQLQCRVLEQLRDGSSAVPEHIRQRWLLAGVDVETVRLALAVLSMERFVGSTAALGDLVSNSASRAARRDTQLLIARFVVAALVGGDEHGSSTNPQPPLDTTLHIAETLERVQSNAHPLSTDGAVVIGVGLFPDAAKALNHSCLPNVVASYDPRSRTLSFRALRTIATREAVEYAYIDLVQPAAERQRVLRDAFGFVCTCWRCVHELSVPTACMRQQAKRARAADAAATQQLVQLQELAVKAVPPELLASHMRAFTASCSEQLARSVELRFTLRMLELQVAVAQHDVPAQRCVATELLQLWREQQLPDVHPTVAVLWRRLQRSCEHAGATAQADDARARAEHIRRVCGLRWPT